MILGSDHEINVLLVDDRPDGLLTLEAVLLSPEYNLIKAQSGKEALTQLQLHEFAVILMDVQMPDMDGFETATQIKQKAQWKDIPIVFVTAIHQDTPYIHAGYKLGAVDYIFKPFDPYILRSKVAVFVDLYRKNMKIRQTQVEILRKEEELYQARKLEAIGRLAGGVAHDFNNLITGILGISQELQNTLEPSDPRWTDLNDIIKASQQAFSLTKQLLAYARRQIITPQILDMNMVVTDMQKMLGRLIGENIALKEIKDPTLGVIKADRGFLEQVLVNLVLNARDAMPDGGTITLQTANVDIRRDLLENRNLQVSPGPYVLLKVSDTGHGMSREIMEHIFEPFFTTKGQDRGTGLGLATVYGIVKQLGGDIWVNSQEGRGTDIEIYLPRVTIEFQKLNTNETVKPAMPRGSETVLVVEDEDLVRRVVTNLLKKQGYNVIEGRNGRAALTLCEQRHDPIDLLITDVVMPEINGRQLVEMLLGIHPEMKVLYMSGYAQDVIARQGILDPEIAFIEKSEISMHLEEKVRQTISNRTSSGAASPPSSNPPSTLART